MKISVAHLLKEPGARESFSFALPPEELVHEEYTFLTPVKVEGVLVNNGNTLGLQGSISGEIQGRCGRCLEPARERFESVFEEALELEDFVDEEALIDLNQWAHEYLLLELPVKLLCRANCRGLCPKCGKVLNEGPCNCEKKDVDPRLAALKNFFDSGQESCSSEEV